ncbi:MAG: methyl-accepting chemotaxis protein [Pseudomonadota bacterium]
MGIWSRQHRPAETDEREAIHAALERVQAIISFNLDGTILHANENFLSAMGYDLDEVKGKHHRMFVRPEHASSQEYRDLWARLGEGQFVKGEFERVSKSGDTVWIEASYNPILNEAGRPVKVVKFASDVTASKLRAADAEGQITAILKSQAVIEFDLDGTVRTANENFLRTVGYSLDEIKGQHHRMFVPSEEASSRDYAEFWSNLAAGKHKAGLFRRVGKGGAPLWLRASYNPILDPSGKITKVVKFANDATKNQLEAADFRGQIDAVSKAQATIEFELDGTIRTANENFLTAMGYQLSEIQGKHHRLFVESSEANGNEYSAFWSSLASGQFKEGEFKRIDKSGNEVWIHATYNPILDPEGKPYKVVKFATDITARKRAVLELDKGLDALSHGDLSVRMPDDITGEFATLRVAFNETMQRLDDLVKGILSTSNSIAEDSEAIAGNAKDLSSRGERQAATIEETSAAMEQITATVKSSAQSAESATNTAQTAADHAVKGGSVVNDAISAMNRIENSSAEIRKIIGVIDSIAFQTNLLALNAGVEAARAGEAGRGFAVVASEVRALAQRASEAAKEINQLIETSSQEVVNGSELVEKSGKSLEEITTGIASVVEAIRDISIAAREQSEGITEVTQAISDIDQATQHTAALSEESAAAATELAQRASELRELVGFFHGGKREAVSTVRQNVARDPEPVPQKPQMRAAANVGGAAAEAIDEGWDEF